MPKGYRTYLPEQELLLPPSLREWLPEDHLVYFVSEVIDQLDLSAIHAVYEKEKRGQPPYDPRLMRSCWSMAIAPGCSARAGYRSGCGKTSRSKYWRRVTSRTSGRSQTFSRSISERWRSCSSRSWRWRWNAGRSNWAGCRWTGRS